MELAAPVPPPSCWTLLRLGAATTAGTNAGVPELYGRAHLAAVAALEELFLGGEGAQKWVLTLPARVAAVSLRASIDAVSSLLREDEC